MKVCYLCCLVLSILQGSLGHSRHCGGVFKAESTPQNVSSPNYPSDYSTSVRCTWVIKAQEAGNQVEVTFDQILTEGCCDFVLVRDGASSSAPVIANFRGNSSGGNYLSTFGALYIAFVSDESINDKGFRFQFQEVPVNDSCGTELVAESSPKLLISPQWPFEYPANVYCKWTISAEPGMQIYFIVLILRTEECCDSLVIRDGLSETSPLLGELRGTTSGKLFSASTGSALSVRFRTDKSVNRVGFMARYFSATEENKLRLTQSPPMTQEDCGGELVAPETGFEKMMSPGFPRPHAESLICAWVITAPSSRRIRIWFNFVNTEECCDWIKVRDGSEPNSPKLGVISGDAVVFHLFESSGNAIRVEFDSNSDTNARGFSAYYGIIDFNEEIVPSTCGGRLQASPAVQHFASPKWPQPYDEDTNCTWVIEASASKMIRLSFLGVITEEVYDEIVIYDGNSTKDTAMFYWSGKSYQTLTISSTGPYMTIAFTADFAVNRGGFYLSYTEEDGNDQMDEMEEDSMVTGSEIIAEGL